MKEIRAVMSLHWIDTRFSFTIFWSILTAVTLVALVFSLTLTNGNMIMGGAPSVFIYLAIHGFINIRETFPFALGMGSTRKSYLLGSFTSYVILAGVSSLFMSGYHYLGNLLFSAFNVSSGNDGGVFLNWYMYSEQKLSALTILGVDFILAFFVLALAQCMSSILYRFGTLIFLSLGGVLLLSIIAPGINEIWAKLFRYFFQTNWVVSLSIWLPIASIVLFFCTWLVLRKSSSKPS